MATMERLFYLRPGIMPFFQFQNLFFQLKDLPVQAPYIEQFPHQLR